MELGGQLHAPASLTPGKDPKCPFHRRLVGLQSQTERCGVEKSLSPTPVVKPVACYYAD
jgi:hypothetical protein